MTINQTDYDVTIIGAGMVGATLAGLLSRCGFSVALVEARQPQAFDDNEDVGLRVSAISPGSSAILTQAGVWKQVSGQRVRPYRRMQVEDGAEAEPILFDAPQFNLERLGTIVENDLLQWSLWQLINAGGLVDIHCPEQVSNIEVEDKHCRVTLGSAKTLTTRLLVGADGAMSNVRKATGISQDHVAYNQSGLVAVVKKQRDNPGVAWQRFLPTGPLAFLPLHDGRSSIVWTLPTQEAGRLLSLDKEAFTDELNSASEGWLGNVETCGPRAAFPLAMRLSKCYASRRTVLVGDAAHVVHPLAGQGVNLGLADIAALTEILVSARQSGRDIGSSEVMQSYDLNRRSESNAMAMGMHAIHGLYGIEALSPLRRIGSSIVRRSTTIKEVFLRRAAGLGHNAPRLATGSSLQDLMRT